MKTGFERYKEMGQGNDNGRVYYYEHYPNGPSGKPVPRICRIFIGHHQEDVDYVAGKLSRSRIPPPRSFMGWYEFFSTTSFVGKDHRWK